MDINAGHIRRTANVQSQSLSVGAYGEGAELPLLLNSSAFSQSLISPQRPLLVRFDWYSRKITPVHIGYIFRTKFSISWLRAFTVLQVWWKNSKSYIDTIWI